MQIKIRRPDGRTYLHRPRVTLCGRAQKSLPAKSTVLHPIAILDGPGGAVFPIPGIYRIEVNVCGFWGCAKLAEVSVAKRPGASDFDPSFARFLADNAPRRYTKQAKRACDIIKKDTRKRNSLVPYLALLLAKQYKKANVIEELLEIASRSSAPLAVRHEAYVLQAKRLVHHPRDLKDFKGRILDTCENDIERITLKQNLDDIHTL